MHFMDLRETRLDRKMSLRKLADACGLSYEAIRQYENGICKPLQINKERLAKALHADIDDLFPVVTESACTNQEFRNRIYHRRKLWEWQNTIKMKRQILENQKMKDAERREWKSLKKSLPETIVREIPVTILPIPNESGKLEFEKAIPGVIVQRTNLALAESSFLKDVHVSLPPL